MTHTTRAAKMAALTLGLRAIPIPSVATMIAVTT
jgi:hypothetical protein